MNRRSFITGMAGILAAGIAPAFVGSSILMPVRQIIVPNNGIVCVRFNRETLCTELADAAEFHEWLAQIDADRRILKSLLASRS